MDEKTIKYRSITVNGTGVFYREAGSEQAPNLLLLHGYPSSSHMFRGLIPLLAKKFHVFAPDLPAFGFSEFPSEQEFSYSFEGYSTLVSLLLEQLGVRKTSYYLFDYGAPILMRVISNNPSSVEMLIFQNGNIYFEGLGEGLKLSADRFANQTPENLSKLQKLVEDDYVRWEYLNGSNQELVAPESYVLDNYLLKRPDVQRIQLSIKENYKTNIPLYSSWQELLKELEPPTLIVWGKNDEVFTPDGALSLHRDIKRSKLIFYPTGHFALEEYGLEIAREIIDFHTRAIASS